MKKPKIPPREKKNSKYKVDEALRFAKKNQDVSISIMIQDFSDYTTVLDYINQKAAVYNLEQFDYKPRTAYYKNIESSSYIRVQYVQTKKIDMSYLSFDYFVIDDRFEIENKNDNARIEKLNFKKFKFAKIDKKRLKELKGE